jgi:ParB family transcriptional regulator, chromosome partitioning protein
MSNKRGGLGRSLSALLQPTDELEARVSVTDKPETEQHQLRILPVTTLQPGVYQPRGSMDEVGLQGLAASIKQQGVLQPIVVRKLTSGRYEIIAGERRWRASQLAKLTEVPVIVRDVNDETAMALALIENMQREALNVMDEARAMHRLSHEFALTHQDIARLLSKSRAAVSNCLRLLNLNDAVKIMLEDGLLDMGHARALLKLSDEEQQHVAGWVVSRGLSVRETEALVVRVKEKQAPVASPDKLETDVMPFQHELQQLSTHLGADVRLKSGQKGRGRLLIDFNNAAHLKQLLARLAQHDIEAVS